MTTPFELTPTPEQLTAFLEIDPTNSRLWINLGDLYHKAGRFEEAITSYDKAMLHDSESSVAQGRIAAVRLSQQRFADAEREFRVLLDRSPTVDPILHYNLGISLFFQQRWSEAQAAFEAAQTAGLDSPKNLGYLVRSLHQQGETGQALELAPRWEANDPSDAVQGYLCLVEMDHGEIDAAHARAQAVLGRQPDNTDARVVVASCLLEQQEVERAHAHFQSVVEAEPDNPRAWIGLGLIQLYRQQAKLAVQTFEKALTFIPDNYGTVVVIGWARLADKDYAGAERSFRQAIEMNHSFAESHGGLAAALVLQRRADEARQAIRLAYRLDRNGFGAAFAQSLLLELEGQHERASASMARWLERAPRRGGTPLIATIQLYARLHLAQSTPSDSTKSD